MAKEKILIVEDEKDIVELIKYNLEKKFQGPSQRTMGRERSTWYVKTMPT